jgi:hypothetical protein
VKEQQERALSLEKNADVAERYPITDHANVDPGELMTIDSSKRGYLKKTTNAYDSGIVGITSSSPGVLLGDWADDTIEVALSGRVPVKIASASAPINPGDFLTSSDTEPGKAMKATRAGTVIGKALEGWSPDSGKETVLTFINLSSYDPDIYLSDLGNLSMFAMPDESTGKFRLVDSSGQDINRVGRFSDAAIANLVSGVINTQKLLINGIDVLDLIQSQKTGSPSGTIANKQLQDMNASISAVQSQTTTHEQKLTDLTVRIASLEANLQYGVAGPGTFTASSAGALSLETLETHEMNVSGALTVLGRTLVNDLGITGKFTAGILSINGIDDDGNATINTLGGDLKIQDNAAGNIDIMAGKITIDTDGNMKLAESITAKKYNVDTQEVAAASLGQATLPEGEVKLDIETSAVTSKSAIFLTPKTKISLPLSVTTQKAGDFFRVEISEPVDKDVKFNWWIVN